MSADKGYDDHKLIDRLWQQHQIKPIIAIRNCWRDGEAEEDGVLTKLVSGQENVIYTHDGQVSCMCPHTGELHSMAYGGFEQDRTPSSTLDLNASESGDDADRAPTRILCATLFVNRPKPQGKRSRASECRGAGILGRQRTGGNRQQIVEHSIEDQSRKPSGLSLSLGEIDRNRIAGGSNRLARGGWLKKRYAFVEVVQSNESAVLFRPIAHPGVTTMTPRNHFHAPIPAMHTLQVSMKTDTGIKSGTVAGE